MLQTKYCSKTWPCSFQEVKMLNCTMHDDGRRPLTTILVYLSDSGYIKTQKQADYLLQFYTKASSENTNHEKKTTDFWNFFFILRLLDFN